MPLVETRIALRRQLPLLHFRLGKNNIQVGKPALAALRAATLWEQSRVARIGCCLAELTAVLHQASISPVLLKGLVLAGTAYTRMELRHCHDLDMLLPEDQIARACDALAPLGFTISSRRRNGRDSPTLVHRELPPVSFHARLVETPFYHLPEVEMISRVTTAVIAGTTVRVLSTPDLLVHVCAHVAARHAPDSTGWVADLATLARHGMFSQSDWDRIVDLASRGGLALPLFTMLRYIDHEIGVSVPPCALLELAECGSHASATARDAALDTACRGKSS